ncbi:MAG: hypothetical protein JW969_14965 [Spirochaetales bacterium]|nr:hypothetical protein [Spirochaetales bacterium]
MDFIQAYKASRKKAGFLWFMFESCCLISLRELLKVVPATGESSAGAMEVPVERIIGSENRSRDFAEGFLPLRSDMQQRWENVRGRFLEGKITKAIDLIEYGGCYFVRDGNHRVSVAKTNGIEFMTANVRTMKTPVKLPGKMSRKRIPLYAAKARFQAETGVFDYIPEDDFFIAIPENWVFLKKEIFEYNQGWYVRHQGRAPEKDVLLSNWNTYIYQTAMEFIRQNYLPFLFPNKEETDIFCDLIRLWNSYPDHDSRWLMDVYNLYLKKALGGNVLLRPFRALKKAWDSLFITDAEARESFLSLCNFNVFVPDAFLPEGGKRWYGFLSDFMLVEYCRHLRKKVLKDTNRLPRMDEVLSQSYGLLLKPAYDEYQSIETKQPFSGLFMKWMKRCGRQFLHDEEKFTAERTADSFRAFLRGKCR